MSIAQRDGVRRGDLGLKGEARVDREFVIHKQGCSALMSVWATTDGGHASFSLMSLAPLR